MIIIKDNQCRRTAAAKLIVGTVPPQRAARAVAHNAGHGGPGAVRPGSRHPAVQALRRLWRSGHMRQPCTSPDPPLRHESAHQRRILGVKTKRVRECTAAVYTIGLRGARKHTGGVCGIDLAISIHIVHDLVMRRVKLRRSYHIGRQESTCAGAEPKRTSSRSTKA